MPKPDWKDFLAALAPLAASAGLIAATPAMLAHAANPTSLAALGVSLATNLIASGLAAYCSPGRLFAHKDFQERLANHDILRLIRTAWGEASHAAVRAYAEAHPARPTEALSLFPDAPPAAFLKTLNAMKPADFVPDLDAAFVRRAIETARRSLLGGGEPPSSANDPRILEQAAQIKTAFVDSIVSAAAEKYASGPPPGFRKFLESGRVTSGGDILRLLSDYVALYLKSDERAQVAFVHFSLQDLADRQTEVSARIEGVVQEIRQSKTDLERTLLDGFQGRLKASTDEVKRHIDQAFNQFVSPQLDPPFTGRHARAGTDFTYRARTTPLIGRAPALEALKQFMDDPRPGLWTVISGPAGTGKSRLAAELIALVLDPDADAVSPGFWRAGFLAHRERWLADEAHKWKPDADTLIAIDYASGAATEPLARLMAHLNRLHGLPGARVRVVLIDRLPPESDLGIVTAFRKSSASGGDAEANRWKADEAGVPDVLALQPLQAGYALDLTGAWAGPRWNPGLALRIGQAMAHDPELGRPLFAALLGDAIATDGLPAGQLNPVSVASAALERLFRKTAVSSSNQGEKAKLLLALATAAQGISEPALFGEATFAALFEGHISDDVLLELKRCVHAFSGTAGGAIPPIEPDFLGGLFVLSCLVRLGQERGCRRAMSLMSQAWRDGRNPGGFLMRLMADFIARAGDVAGALARDGERPTLEEVRELLVTLGRTAADDGAASKRGPAVMSDLLSSTLGS